MKIMKRYEGGMDVSQTHAGYTLVTRKIGPNGRSGSAASGRARATSAIT